MTRVATGNYSFHFIPTDNSYSIANCTLVLNSALNISNNSIINEQDNNITSINLLHDLYNWTVNCTDPSGNIGTNITTKRFYVDLLGPGFNLITPYEGETFNYNDVRFNFTVYEQFQLNLSVICNLSLDERVNVSGIVLMDGYTNSTLIPNILEGDHNWSVTCWDNLNNTNTSQTLPFIVNAPDLTISPINITFNNTNPNLNDTIKINATVYNIGGIPANSFNVYFLDNMVEITNLTVTTLQNGQSTTLNTTWNITFGFHTITVNITYNGVELNSTNNLAENNLTLLYPTFTNPINNTWSKLSSNQINYRIYDYQNSNLNYSMYIDSNFNFSSNATDGIDNSLILNFSEGFHNLLLQSIGPRSDYQGILQNLNRTKNKPYYKRSVNRTYRKPSTFFCYR